MSTVLSNCLVYLIFEKLKEKKKKKKINIDLAILPSYNTSPFCPQPRESIKTHTSLY